MDGSAERLSQAQIAAARGLVEMAERDGREPSAFVRAIAEARPGEPVPGREGPGMNLDRAVGGVSRLRPAQVEAARALVQMDKRDGRPTSELVLTIANSRPGDPHPDAAAASHADGIPRLSRAQVEAAKLLVRMNNRKRLATSPYVQAIANSRAGDEYPPHCEEDDQERQPLPGRRSELPWWKRLGHRNRVQEKP